MNKKTFEELCETRLSHIDEKVNDRKIWVLDSGDMGGGVVRNWLNNKGYKYGVIRRYNEQSIENLSGFELREMSKTNPEDDFVIVSSLYFDLCAMSLLLSHGFSEDDFCIIVYLDNSCSDIETNYKGVKIGRYTYGHETLLADVDSTYVKCIGSFCSINHTARICLNHPISTVSTHTLFYAPLNRIRYINNVPLGSMSQEWMPSLRIEIGHDVWIGSNVVILPDVTIGTGAVIGAGAVVTKNVDPYQIVGGVPAKLIRNRVNSNIIPKLLEIKWWEWDIDVIVERIADFKDPSSFVEKYGR